MKPFSLSNEKLAKYVYEVFRPEDSVLADIRERACEAGLPDIHVGKMDGLHLEILTRSINARKIVEIGTLAGYSGVCLARGLTEGGRLYTFEFEPKHAEVAAESFRRAAVSDKVQIIIGPAIENLKKIEGEGPFDLVFIDADKRSYPAFFEWAVSNLRRGGVMLADNTFWQGEIVNANANRSPRIKGLQEFNERCAKDSRLRATILPTSDGLTFAVRV